MTTPAAALLANALRPNEGIRAEIAAIESGSMSLESWDAVKHRIATDVLGR